MDWFWNLWNSISPGARDNIIGGLVAGIVLAIGGFALRQILKRRSVNSSSSDQIPQSPRQELVIKVEPHQPPPKLEEAQTAQTSPPDRTTNNIPRRPPVGFVARRDKQGREITVRLKEELTPEKSQLIALWGKGGVGKTTLAAETAREMIDAFRMRIVWTTADGREDYSLSTLLDEIATQLGNADLRRLALEPKKEDVRALIASQATLIVLDNFETISLSEQKNCAEWIAQHAPCPALLTTRVMIPAALNISIDAMSPPEAREYLERLIGQDANARAFKGLDRDSIIKAADANPLVMQWVIAQISLAQQPRDVLNDLSHGEGDAAQRVFDRSFKLEQLGDDGRDALLALSLFVPSASRAALADVAGFGDDQKRLNVAVKNLAALCLVETTDAGERLIIEGLTRELAKARLSKDKRANEFRGRFVAYFLQYSESHAKTTPEDFDALEAERDNVLSAMDVASEINYQQSVMRIMDAIGGSTGDFLSVRGYWDEAIRRGEQAIMAARNLGIEAELARFTHNLAVMYQKRGDLKEASQLCNESLEIRRKLGDQSGIAYTLHQLAMIAQVQGKIDEARRLHNEGLELEKKLGDQKGIALAAWALGNIALDQGKFEEAKKRYSESLETFKGLGDQNNIAGILHQMGRLAQVQGELDEARRLYNESLEIEKKIGDQEGIALTLGQLGRLAEDEGAFAKAAQLFREALNIFERLGSPYVEMAQRDLKRVEDED